MQDSGHTPEWNGPTVERVMRNGKRIYVSAFKAWLVEQALKPEVSVAGLALRHGDGDVRLKVSVQSDGSLRQIDLLQSSGSAALDRAAVDTVEKLAPFAPFPEALAHETQQLDIVRTWQFRR